MTQPQQQHQPYDLYPPENPILRSYGPKILTRPYENTRLRSDRTRYNFLKIKEDPYLDPTRKLYTIKLKEDENTEKTSSVDYSTYLKRKEAAEDRCRKFWNDTFKRDRKKDSFVALTKKGSSKGCCEFYCFLTDYQLKKLQGNDEVKCIEEGPPLFNNCLERVTGPPESQRSYERIMREAELYSDKFPFPPPDLNRGKGGPSSSAVQRPVRKTYPISEAFYQSVIKPREHDFFSPPQDSNPGPPSSPAVQPPVWKKPTVAERLAEIKTMKRHFTFDDPPPDIWKLRHANNPHQAVLESIPRIIEQSLSSPPPDSNPQGPSPAVPPTAPEPNTTQ